ncbi:MAG: peptide chain release factor N(5)-glutamine methyltransferase [Bacteroidota bacterium]
MDKSLKTKELLEKIESSINHIYEAEEIIGISRLIWEDILNLSELQRVSNSSIQLSEEAFHKLEDCLGRLQKQEPIQQIIGFVEFYGRKFKVDQNVLIPRPETEELCHLIINRFKDRKESLNIIDLGTGSGCIASTLSNEIINSNVSASDISLSAIQLAKINAVELEAEVEFIHDDICNSKIDQQFQLIVSNPPYVTLAEKKEMKANVLAFEPHLALFAPEENPLFFYEKICDFAINHLHPEGYIYLEINHLLYKETLDLFSTANFKEVEAIKSLNGHYRFVSCIKT